MKLALLIAVVLVGASCRRQALSPPAPPLPPPSAAVAPTATAVAPAPMPAAAAPAEEPSTADEALVAEDRDPDPRSPTVTIKLIVDGRRKAHVFWGRKDLGEAPLELQRPRDSGPLDLLVVAPGYLPLHTRVFTDRDDKLFLRLFSLDQGPQLLGYAPPAADHPPRRAP